MVSEVGVLHEAVLKKLKSIAPERHKVTKYYKTQQLRAKINSSAEPADLPEAVSSTAARTPRSTRAGGQDDDS